MNKKEVITFSIGVLSFTFGVTFWGATPEREEGSVDIDEDGKVTPHK